MSNLNLSADEFVYKLEIPSYLLASMKADDVKEKVKSYISFIQHILPESKHSRTAVTFDSAKDCEIYNIVFTNPKYPRIKEVRTEYKRFADFLVGTAIAQSNLLTSVEYFDLNGNLI